MAAVRHGTELAPLTDQHVARLGLGIGLSIVATKSRASARSTYWQLLRDAGAGDPMILRLEWAARVK